MRKRPILFSGAMVRALLDGSKTQTRRIVKSGLEIAAVGSGDDWNRHKAHPAMQNPLVVLIQNNGRPFSLPCPYGQVGDRLWVRETFQGPMWEEGAWDPDADYHFPKYCEYRADGGPTPEYVDFDDNLHQGWKPSIHMPRWASRITLEITGVRIERLQEISPEDSIAEGIEFSRASFMPQGFRLYDQAGKVFCTSPIESYRSLWDSLKPAAGAAWADNPWVWVVEFKRVTP